MEELRNEKKGETIINYSVKALRKSYLRAMNYIWTHAIQNTYEITFSGFTGIFKDILVKSLLLLLFLQRYSCSILVLAFQLCGCRPDYNILKQLVTAFFKKTFFLQNPILELSNYTVPVKGVASPILTDNKLLQGHFLKFGDSIQWLNSYVFSVHLFFRTLFRSTSVIKLSFSSKKPVINSPQTKGFQNMR